MAVGQVLENKGRQLRFLHSQIMITDLRPHKQTPSNSSKEWAADFMNAFKPGTSMEVCCLARSVSGDPAGCHVLILRAELPAWEAAARVHGVRLIPTTASARGRTWDGDVSVKSVDPDSVV